MVRPELYDTNNEDVRKVEENSPEPKGQLAPIIKTCRFTGDKIRFILMEEIYYIYRILKTFPLLGAQLEI